MVIGVFGLPGMGKTTMLTAAAHASLSGKRFLGIPPHDKVYTSFECPGCYQLDFSKFGKYKFENALIIIDEIMLYADSRDFKNFSDDQKYFWSHSRHANLTVLWASQQYDDCDKKIRGLTDHYYLLEKSKFLPVSYVKPIVRHLGARQGSFKDTVTLGAPLSWTFIWRPKYYKLFDSFVYRDLPPVDDVPWIPESMNQTKKARKEAKKEARQAKKEARQAKKLARQAKKLAKQASRRRSRDWLDLIPSPSGSEEDAKS